MTKLLVSVRDAVEAKIALDAGVDLIDIKEPRHGSLGKADDKVIGEIAQVVGQRRPLSAALGELADYTDDCLAQFSLPRSIRFAKIGLARCQSSSAWPRRLAMLWRRLPPNVGRIAVIYVDWRAAAAPSPEAVLQQATELGCRGILIDTFDKANPGLTALWSPKQLRDIALTARKSGFITVFAGRISTGDLAQLLPHQPDYIAIRGAVCHPDRNGMIEAARICAFRKLLAPNLEFA
jgi:(5-formylfuran-3-yl)methyl phosphate synthase